MTQKQDDFDIDAIAKLNFDGVDKRVEEMQEGGGEVLEPSNKCESGACEI